MIRFNIHIYVEWTAWQDLDSSCGMILDGRGPGTDVPDGMRCCRKEQRFSSTKRDRNVIHQCLSRSLLGVIMMLGVNYQSPCCHKLNITTTFLCSCWGLAMFLLVLFMNFNASFFFFEWLVSTSVAGLLFPQVSFRLTWETHWLFNVAIQKNEHHC